MKFLRILFLALVLLAGGRGTARAQVFQWAKLARVGVDTTNILAGQQLSATDATGNTYVSVPYGDSLVAGAIRLTGPRFNASALIKYDAAGTVLWAKDLRNIRIIGLAADNNAGGVFVAAYQQGGTASWDGTSLGLSSAFAFQAKCTAAGSLQWSQALPSLAYGNFTVVADPAGSAYWGGTATANGTVGGTAVASGQSFILKTNGAGTAQWTQLVYVTGTNSLTNFRLGPKTGGGCLMSGTFGGNSGGTLFLGAGTSLLTTPSLACFVSSLDAAGAPQWSQIVSQITSQSSTNVSVNATAADAAGNVYVTGNSYNGFRLAGTTLVGGFYLAKYDATGAAQWARGQQLTTNFNYNDAGQQLAVNNDGANVVVRSINPLGAPIVLNGLTLRTYYNFAHYTPQGQEQWAVADSRLDYNPLTPITTYLVPVGLGLDGQGRLYAANQLTYPRFGQPASFQPAIQLGALTTVGKGTIVTRINPAANTLRGRVYLDQNGNGQPDASEGMFPLPLAAALTQGGGTSFFPTGTAGELQAYAEPGPYALSLARVPANYTVSQPTGGGVYTGNFNGSGQVTTGQFFGIVPIVNQADVRVTLTPYSPARVGIPLRYRLSLENVGTTTASGTATVTLDGRMTYVSSTPAASRTGQVLTWTYTNLAPFGRLDYDITFSLPTNVAPNTALSTQATATLAADVNLDDNTANANELVVAAYDPNDIQVSYERLTPAQVAAAQPLDYTIRFQNIGNAAAFDVVITDTLNLQKLNAGSIQMVAQSHNCTWMLSGSGIITIRFLNINLPERNVDVLRSQGFVRFRIVPRTTLALGDIIPNLAHIVFDYNPPITTNTATTTVFIPTAIRANHTALAWSAYPNPAAETVNLTAELKTGGLVTVDLFDALGRPVQHQTLTAPAGTLRQSLDVRSLAPGLYLLRLRLPDGSVSSQQVLRQ